MGTASQALKRWKNLTPLARFCARNFIEFRRRESFKTDLLLSITIDSSIIIETSSFELSTWCNGVKIEEKSCLFSFTRWLRGFLCLTNWKTHCTKKRVQTSLMCEDAVRLNVWHTTELARFGATFWLQHHQNSLKFRNFSIFGLIFVWPCIVQGYVNNRTN